MAEVIEYNLDQVRTNTCFHLGYPLLFSHLLMRKPTGLWRGSSDKKLREIFGQQPARNRPSVQQQMRKWEILQTVPWMSLETDASSVKPSPEMAGPAYTYIAALGET